MKRQPHQHDEYGFLADIAGLEDAHGPPASGRSTQELLAGLADFEPATAPPPSAGSKSTAPPSRSSDDLLAGLADLEDAKPVTRKKRKSRRPSGMSTAFSQLEDAHDQETVSPASERASAATVEPDRPAAAQAPPRPAPAAELRPAAPPAPTAETSRPTPVVSPPPAAPRPPAPIAAPAPVLTRPTYSPPPKNHNGGSSFDFSSLTGLAKPLGIAAAVLVVGYLGYLGFSRLGFAGSINASTVYTEVLQLNKDFEAVSAKGPESPEFTAFYDHYGKRHAELYQMMGNPSAESKAYKVKAALGHLYSAVAAFKMKFEKSEQQAEREQLKQALDLLKQEMGS